MKLVSKWMELENIILNEVTETQKEHTSYALTDKQNLAQKLRIPMIQPANHMQFKKKTDQSEDTSIIYKMGNKIIPGTRGTEGPGREKGMEGERGGSGTGIGRDRREVRRIRKLNRNM